MVCLHYWSAVRKTVMATSTGYRANMYFVLIKTKENMNMKKRDFFEKKRDSNKMSLSTNIIVNLSLECLILSLFLATRFTSLPV